tara:strand:- start:2140 stop:2337 length:198 start_codon:yes stop_codon:yes gene_type:complete
MIVTEDGNRQNIFPKEPPIEIMTDHNHENDRWHIAEELNGRAAMAGFIIAIGTYLTTGQIIPGVL